MQRKSNVRVKVITSVAFAVFGLIVFLSGDERVGRRVEAFSDGPPPGFTGAPGEQTCTNCHSGEAGPGQFTISPPLKYVPGRTYQVAVQHTTTDATRLRWGFQATALAATTMAGSFTNTDGFTQMVGGSSGRDYIEQTLTGSFAGTVSPVSWNFNWTAPATNVGPVTFYAAGNQANNQDNASGDLILTATAISNPVRSVYDFDGDGKTDLGIFRPTVGEWWINRSSNATTFAAQFGASSDRITPGDYTGDGKSDIAFFRPSSGEWYILRSEDFSFFSFPFGTGTDTAAPADYDNDGKTDAAVFRPSSATWFIRRSSDGGTTIEGFGQSTDIVAPADYDGDGKADIAIYRPSLGQWWINRSTAGVIAFTFGNSSDKPVQGDYTGDGKADVAFFRPSTGEWFVLRSNDFSFYSVPFGNSSDIVAPGDYDGDGRFDTAIFRPSETNWYVNRSTAGLLIQQFGAAGDRPIPNAYVP